MRAESAVAGLPRACLLVLVLVAWTALAPAKDGGLEDLVRAYPDQFSPTPKPNVLLWKDGTETVYDDGVARSFDEMLKNASPKDQMALPYPAGWPMREPGIDEDPGRIRCEALFRKMYGGTAATVEGSLVDVPWLPGGTGETLRFTSVNGAAEALRRVAAEANTWPAELKRYVAKPGGTFVWRVIAGEDRLSPHSFGIAVDFELPKPLYRYWRWDMKGTALVPPYPRNVIENADFGRIVSVFETNGFVWGGKWQHYDTMHFEYRPELVLPKSTPQKSADGR